MSASRARLLQTGNRLAQLRFRDGGEELGTHNDPGAVNGEYRIETCSRPGCRINRYQRHDDPRIQTRKQVGLHIKQIPVTMLVTEHLKARHDSELSMARERQPRSLYIGIRALNRLRVLLQPLLTPSLLYRRSDTCLSRS